MRKWTLLLAALLVVALTAPAVAKPPPDKGKPAEDLKESCWDIRYHHGATAWNLADGVTEETPWLNVVESYPLVAGAPACFDLPEPLAGDRVTDRQWRVSWAITQGSVQSLLITFAPEIYADDSCHPGLVVNDPASTGSVVLTIDETTCQSSIAPGYVLKGMIDQGARRRGKSSAGEPGAVTFSVEPVG